MGSGKLEGGITCVKWLMWIFNFLFFLVGLALIIAGALIQTNFKEYVTVLGAGFSFAPIVIIVVGCIIFIVAFFGCCGAWKENYCMVMTFAALMVLILILELTGAIAGFVMKGKVNEQVKKGLNAALNGYYKEDIYKDVIDKMQKQFSCCGVSNSSDWKGDIPKSCNNTDTGKPYTRGCYQVFKDFASTNVLIIGGISLAFCFLQFVGILFACCLGRAIKKEYEVV